MVLKMWIALHCSSDKNCMRIRIILLIRYQWACPTAGSIALNILLSRVLVIVKQWRGFRRSIPKIWQWLLGAASE